MRFVPNEMEEVDYFSCADAAKALAFVCGVGTLSERKARLFATACCRWIWNLIPDQRSRWAVEAAELAVDGKVAEKVRLAAADQALDALAELFCKRARRVLDGKPTREEHAADAAHRTAAHDKTNARVVAELSEKAAGAEREPGWPVHLIHDICGPLPFRTVALHPIWRTPTVTGLARAAYEVRVLPSGILDREHLAVLADALLDAGCDDAPLLNHLRGPGPHVRGCFAVDAILGRE